MNDSLKEVSEALEDLLKANAEAFNFKDVYYGDERLIPRTPAASVVPDTKRRELVETGHTVINTFQVLFVIYHSRLESVQVTRKECDELAEQVEALLHGDKRLGGMLYTSHVTSMTPGYATKGKVVMQATRLTWQGRSKTRI